MKKLFLRFTALLIISATATYGQTTLPYYTGFDNAAQQAGWQEFRKGVTSVSHWSIGAIGHSAPNQLSHDYPVGGSATDTVIDWYVSPPFHFYGGGHIDSLQVNLFSITGNHTAADQCQLYLLAGSPDPDLADSMTLLADLTAMASSANVWVDTGSFLIPPTQGSSYIAIKYRATNDWFVPNLDDIHLSGDTATSVRSNTPEDDKISLFPNPASQTISLSLPDSKLRTLILTDVYGRCIRKMKAGKTEASLDISGLAKGAYCITVVQDGKTIKAMNWIKN